ncbi:MAG TPA: hypothetical protein VM532_08140 [Burkholderiales bacterium]|jgi:hypothetical protein|nr:hypothetical protein [Burkholderiales bacterium]
MTFKGAIRKLFRFVILAGLTVSCVMAEVQSSRHEQARDVHVYYGALPA